MEEILACLPCILRITKFGGKIPPSKVELVLSASACAGRSRGGVGAGAGGSEDGKNIKP